MKRTITMIILLAVAVTLSAQEYSTCYQKKYEEGVDLYNKGNYSFAKVKFAEAKKCPEPNTKQADSWIGKCNAKINEQKEEVAKRNAVAETSGSGVPKIFTVGGVTFKMLYVQGGTFTMGCTREQGGDCDSDEYPTHGVTVPDFWLGETEVTQALWKAVMGKNPSYFVGDNMPVEQVS